MTLKNRRSISLGKSMLALFVTMAASLSFSAAHAQSTMTIDGNCSFTLSTSTTTPAVQVNPATGNVTVNSQSGVACSPASATLNVPSTVAVGQSFTASWTSSGTTSCNTSGGIAGWPATGRPVTGSQILTAPGTPQTVNFTLSCVTGGTPVTDTKTVQFTGTASVNLTAPTQSPVSQSFTLSWSSTGTTSCTPTGGTGTAWASQSIGTSGSVNLTGPANPGNVLFGITCNTGSGTVADNETIQFTDIDPGCGGVTLPPNVGGFAQQTWSTRYGGQFPLVYSTNVNFNVSSGQGLRLAITPTVPTNGDSANGTLTYNEASGVPRAGFMTISRCPGDFRINILNQPAGCDGVFTPCTTRCHTGPEASGQLSLSFRLQGTANNVCNITPGVPHFVNIHFGGTSTPGPDGAFCGGAQCAIIGGTQEFFSRESLALQWLEGDMLGLSEPEPKVISLPLEALTITPDP